MSSGFQPSPSTSSLADQDQYDRPRELLWSRLRGAALKSVILIGTVAVIFGSLQNTLTFYLKQFWGGAGNTWQSMWTGFLDRVGDDDYNLFVYGSFAVANIFLFGGGIIYSILDFSNIEWIKKYKIQPGTNEPTPDIKKFISLIKTVVFNQTVVLLPYMMVLYKIRVWRNATFGPLFVSEHYNLRVLPEFHWVLMELPVFLLAEEIGFYYSHKLAHHRRVYKYVHKKHHEWTAPIGFTAVYAHPIEHIVSNIGPVVLGPIICGSHLATLWLWLSMAIMNTLNSHSGYHFPFFPSPEAHDFHHLKFTQCYGVLGVLDYLHGTDDMFRSSKAYQRHVMMLNATPIRETYPDVDPKEKGL